GVPPDPAPDRRDPRQETGAFRRQKRPTEESIEEREPDVPSRPRKDERSRCSAAARASPATRDEPQRHRGRRASQRRKGARPPGFQLPESRGPGGPSTALPL